MLAIAAWFYFPGIFSIMNYKWSLRHSISLPRKPDHFVGREEELKSVTNFLDFATSDSHLVSIVGGPGFGKSALAVSAAHELLFRGVTVYYVDMAEVSSMQALAEKVLEGDKGIVIIHNITVERMYKWSRQLYYKTVLLLDNCDDMLNKDSGMKELQKLIKKLLKYTRYLKILTTSRQKIELSEFKPEYIALHELEMDSSCALIKHYDSHLTDNQCQKIGYLTGNVPLAVKVVGSLLNQPYPPTPDAVISRLEKALIPTLSPKGLPVDERVSTCINVSYECLSPDVKVFGHCLAKFPGSFDVAAAISVCTYFKYQDFLQTTGNESIIIIITNLVQRSLLHPNKLAHSSMAQSAKTTDRFQFHRLIREFFLEVNKPIDDKELPPIIANFVDFFMQWSLKTKNKHPLVCILHYDMDYLMVTYLKKLVTDMNTDVGFHYYFVYLKAHITVSKLHGYVLSKVTNSFNERFLSHFTQILALTLTIKPTSVLGVIDQERHNLLHFLRLLQVPEVIYHDTHFFAIHVVRHHSVSKFLQYRFTINELYWPIQGMVKYLELNYGQLNGGLDYVATYASLVLQLASFEEELGGISRAMKILQTHEGNIERLLRDEVYAGKCTECQEFFEQVATYCEFLGDSEKSKRYHEKVLSLIYNKLECQPDSCTYANIGLSYYAVNKVKYSIQFIELALKREDMDPVSRVHLVTTLHRAYDDNKQKKEELVAKALDLYPTLMNESTLEVFEKYEYFSHVVKWMRELGRTDEADALEEKQLEALNGPGCLLGNKASVLEKAIPLSEKLYLDCQYSKSAKLALFALKLAKDVNIDKNRVYRLRILKLVFYSQFYAGNYSDALVSHDALLEYLYQHNETHTHSKLFIDSCILVMWLGAFNCTHNAVSMLIQEFFYVPLYFLELVYFDYLLDTLLEFEATQSSSTDLMLPSSLYYQVEQYIGHTWWPLFKTMLTFMLKYIFRAILWLLYLIFIVGFVFFIIIIIFCVFCGLYFFLFVCLNSILGIVLFLCRVLMIIVVLCFPDYLCDKCMFLVQLF